MKMKKKKYFLIITSILTLLLACVQIQAATVKTPTHITVTASKKASISVKWAKVSNASGYEIWRARSANGKYTKIKTVTGNSTVSYTNTKLRAGRYYYKVRACRTVNNENIYSNFTKSVGSTVKVINIMKDLPPLSPSYVGKYSTIINKIGGMTKKNNSRYPSFYAAGNKIILGVNYNASYSRNQKYVYISNRGNYGVGIGGMQLGMTLSEAASALSKNGLRSFNNPTVFWWGNAANITLTVKNNIVTGFTYVCAPTSD